MDRYNNVWTFYENGSISVYDGITKKVIYTQNIDSNTGLERNNRINDITYSHDKNSFFISTKSKIIELDCNFKNRTKFKILWAYKCESSYIKIIDTNHILCVNHNNFFIIDPLNYKRENLSENYIANNNQKMIINNIFIDYHKNLWLSTQSGLWLSYPCDFPFSIFSFNKDVIKKGYLKSINSINDSIIVANLEQGLITINIATNSVHPHPVKYSYDYFFSFNKKIIYSRREGVFIANRMEEVDKNFSPLDYLFPELKPLYNLGISEYVSFSDSINIFLTRDRNAIMLWNSKAKKTMLLSASIYPTELNSNINKIYKDRNNKLWILTDSKVLIYDVVENKVKIIRLDNKFNLFLSIIQIKDDYYLSSYNNGIIHIDQDYQFIKTINKEKDGLYNNQVLNLIPEDSTSLFFWLTTSGGLSRIDLKNFSVSNFDIDDGIPLNGFQLYSALLVKDKIFLYDTKGFIKIQPKTNILSAYSPQFVLTGYKFKQRQFEFDSAIVNMKSLEVPSDVLQISIFFRLINYVNAKNNNYSYRIKEFQNEWINIEKQNYLTFIGLPPGTYHVELKGGNGVTGESKSFFLRMTIMPHWYQQWWVVPVLFCFACFIILLIYRHNIRIIREKHAIRKEIAADLHDDIGSALNSIKIFAHLARQSPDKREYFVQIDGILKQASLSIRDMIWVLDNSDDTFNELIDRLKRFLLPVAEASNISLSFFIHEELRSRQVTKTLKRNIFLIAKEAINNSIKYSKCDLILMKVYVEKSRLIISLYDNGIGFDITKIEKGNGLDNMQFRADQIGFNLEISSFTGKGTNVFLSSKWRGITNRF